MVRMLFTACTLALLISQTPALADPYAFSASTQIDKVLADHKGKRVTLKLQSGQETTGLVRDINNQVVYLGELSGKDFFGAIVRIDRIEAVLIREK